MTRHVETGEPRVALVTGAARGMGAATVDALVSQGYRVVAVDLGASGAGPLGVKYQLATAEDLRRRAESWGDAAVTVAADVTDPAAMRRAAEVAVAEFGHLDAVVAAAAVIAGGQLAWEFESDVWDSLWQVDVLGVVHTAAATIPLLREYSAGTGRFVAISSAAGQRGLYGLSAYCAVKHAVIGFVRGLAADLIGTGVTACAVAPGATDTEMLQATSDLYGLSDTEQLGQHALIQRVLEPAELAYVIASCCSPMAAALNGSVVSADGGAR